MTTLDPASITYAGLSLVDDCGRVFMWQGRVLRGIRAEAVDDVRRLLDSGLIQELVTEGLFPRTWITDLEAPGFALVLEHQRIDAITYPFEWSFGMVKAAALAVLRVNEIAVRFGYELKDCHGYNVAFDGGRPQFLDFGSFVRRQPGAKGWRAYEEFVQSYLYPLHMWRAGNHYLAQKVLADQALMPHESYLLYRQPLARHLGGQLRNVAKLFYVYYKSRLISEYPPEQLRERLPTQLGRYLDWALALDARGLLPLQRVDLGRLRHEVEQLQRRGYQTTWGDYHDQLAAGAATPRFERIAALVRDLGIRTAVELAGNQGVVARLLLERTPVQRVVCTDGDETAVDRLFSRVKGSPGRLVPAILDFMIPVCPGAMDPPHVRYRAEAAIALAVTHHLLLKPPFFKLEQVLATIGQYATRYVFIEFMPMGLFDNVSAAPLPAWYTLDWFRGEFARAFDLRLEEQLESNRVLFVGAVRGPRQLDRLPDGIQSAT